MTESPVPLKTKNDAQRRALWQALSLAWELGYLIVVPLLLFGLGGRWLDHILGTSPWLFLGGMAMAVAMTTVFLVRKFAKIIRDLDQTPPASNRP